MKKLLVTACFLCFFSLVLKAGVYSGKDHNIDWNLDTSTGVLTLGGNGEMNNYGENPFYDYDGNYRVVTNAPWGNYYDQIKEVVIQIGVTRIGTQAFRGCEYITSVTFSEWGSMKTIGAHAFDGCRKLISVKLPEYVTSIEEYAFIFCDQLSSIYIPSGVTEIKNSAFEECKSLASITIPGSVMAIEPYTFKNCYSLSSITIPYSVSSINGTAFDGCSALTEIHSFMPTPLSVNFTDVDMNKCTLYVPASYIETYQSTSGWNEFSQIVAINTEGVDGNIYWNLDTETGVLTLSGNGEMNNYGEKTIDGYRIWTEAPWGDYYGQIKEAVILTGVTRIGNNAFRGCDQLTSVTIPKGVTTIGTHAFDGCRQLSSVGFPEGLTNIGEYAFVFCDQLKSVDIPKDVTSIGDRAFQNCHALSSVTISANVTSFGEYVFEFCDVLTSVILENGTTIIGNGAFQHCTSLTSVNIANSVTSIGHDAFNDCSSLASITIPNGVTSIPSGVFYGCSLMSLTIGSGVKSINPQNFQNRPIKTIWLCNTPPTGYSDVSGKINYVANDQFKSLENTIIYPSLSSLFTVNGVKYVIVSTTDRTCAAIDCTYDASEENIHISETVTYKNISLNVQSINDYAFYKNPSIKNVEISHPGTLGNYAFYICAGIQKASLSNEGSIGNQTFYDCDGLQEVHINNDGSIGNQAFYDCGGLQEVYISNNGDIESSAFMGCDKLQEVYINNNGDIKSEAFLNCGLKTGTFIVDIRSTGDIGKNAFAGSGLTSANIENSGDIAAGAFSKCASLSTATLGANVTTIGDKAFQSCTSLQSIDIPAKVTSVGQYSFDGCTSLASATFNGKTSIAQNTFNKCSSLQQVILKEGVSLIDSYAFNGCQLLPEITIPSSVSQIGSYAFSGCTSLADVTIADRTTALTLGSNGSSALFADCPLDEVYIGGKITYNTSSSYGYSPFYRNTSLRAVTIADTETEIYDNEFYGCSGLTDVTIGDGVKSIGKWAFSGCASLDYFAFGTSLKSIGQEAFSDCTALTRIISQVAVPPTCGSEALQDINKWECELTVPTGYTDAYAAAAQWQDFFFTDEEDVIKTFTTTLAAEYGTWIVPVDADLPEGLKAYTCTNTNGNTLELVPATSIVANVPYLIEGEAGKTYEVTGTMKYANNLTSGILTGVYEDTEVTVGYVLQDRAEGLGFYRIGSYPINVTAHHCYATLPEASTPMIRISDATRIENVESESDDQLHDLMGRKITDASAKGIYIKNGQKVFIK